MKLLVADDDRTLREELASLLREDGHEVATAEDGGEALRIVDRESFEVALLDLRMPKATGLEVLHRIRVVRPETAVVMITGEGTIDAAVEAMKSGAIDFVEKPYDLEALRRTLRSVQDERKAKAMIGAVTSGEAAVGEALSDAARRNALLAVVGPDAQPPAGASRILRIDEAGRPPDTFAPSQLYHLNAAVDAYLKDVDRPVLYAADLGMLEALHGRADMRAWVRHLSGKVSAKGGTLVLRSVDPEIASEVGGMETEAPSEALQGMLESLANPIRRAVVGYVFASGPVAYSMILKRNFVDSSSKLSFHLQKLQADGLLTKVDAGRYSVTEAGQRAWTIVRALSDRTQPSILLSKS